MTAIALPLRHGWRTTAGLQRVWVGVVMAAFVGLLRYSYSAVIVPTYGYLGYAWVEPTPLLECAMVGLALLPVSLLPLRLTRPSQYVHWILYPMVVIPALVVPMYNGLLPPLDLLTLSCAISACFFALLLAARLPTGRWPQFGLPPSLFWLGVLGFVVLALASIQVVFGAPVSLPSLSQVYQRREEFKDTVQASGSGVVYLSLWLANVINPLLMARGILERRWLWGAVGLVGQAVVFGISGFKTVLLAPALIVGMTILMGGQGRRFGLRFSAVMAGGLLAGLVIGPLLPADLITGLLVRRVIITPGLLTGVYDQYFSTHPPALLGYGLFRGLAPNVYGQVPALVIGEYLTPGQSQNANANFWADAFANFGFAGMFVFTALLALVLWLYDTVTAGKRLEYAVLILAMPTIVLTNSALLTCIGTHGLGLAIIVMALIPGYGRPISPAGVPAT